MAFLPRKIGNGDVVDEGLLLAQDAHRVGPARIRFSALVAHPLQRSIDQLWVESLALRHFENGLNIQKGTHPIMVMAVKEGQVELYPVPEGLPTANPAAKFYLISGQHRVAAMKYIIKKRLSEQQERDTIHDIDVLNEPDAEWPAIVFRNELESSNPNFFTTFMDSLNVIQNVLQNSITRVWSTASALAATNSPHRDHYVKTLIPASTNHRSILRALKHPMLREAVDNLIKIPLFDPSVNNFAYWTTSGGCMISAAILQEAFHSFDRLTQQDDSRRSQITTQNVFGGKDYRIHNKAGFMALSSRMDEEDQSLWSQFAPNLPTFDERWKILMTRDSTYESLLHESGNEEPVLPWALTKHAISSSASQVSLWIQDLKAIIQMVILISDKLQHNFSSAGGRTFDYHDELDRACQKIHAPTDSIFRFCCRHNQDLIVFPNKIWDRDAHPFLGRQTPTTYTTPLGVSLSTVAEAAVFMLQVDQHWWDLAHMLQPIFINGLHTFPSGIVLNEKSPSTFKKMIEQGTKAYTDALEAKKSLDQHQSDRLKLQAQLASQESKTGAITKKEEMTKKIKKLTKLLQEDTKVVTVNAKKYRKLLLKHQEQHKLPPVASSPRESTPPSRQPSPGTQTNQSSVPKEQVNPYNTYYFCKDVDGDFEEVIGEEGALVREMLESPNARAFFGDHLPSFQRFLERALQPTVLSLIFDGEVRITKRLENEVEEVKSEWEAKLESGGKEGINRLYPMLLSDLENNLATPSETEDTGTSTDGDGDESPRPQVAKTPATTLKGHTPLPASKVPTVSKQNSQKAEPQFPPPGPHPTQPDQPSKAGTSTTGEVPGGSASASHQSPHSHLLTSPSTHPASVQGGPPESPAIPPLNLIRDRTSKKEPSKKRQRSVHSEEAPVPKQQRKG